MSAIWLGYGLLYIPFDAYAAARVCIIASVLYGLILLSYRTFRYFAFIWYCAFVINMVGVPLVHFIFGGFAQSGMIMLWLLISPIETLVVYKPRHGLMMFLAVAATFIIIAFLQPYNLQSCTYYLNPSHNKSAPERFSLRGSTPLPSTVGNCYLLLR